MNKQPLFAVCQLSRDEQFSVSTYLMHDGKRRYVIKKPNTSSSKKHLENMVSSYAKIIATKPLSKLIVPAPIEKLADGSVSFDFIEGKSVERILIANILDKKSNEATKVIDRLLSIIDSLPAKQCTSTELAGFINIFGDSYGTTGECVTPGIIDLNLDNIIEDRTGKWHLIDYEWVFDFPVPKTYLAQRFIYWFFVLRYQNILRYHANRIEQVLIAPDISVPTYIYDRYQELFLGLNRVTDTETKFQEYVLGMNLPLRKIEFFENSDINKKEFRPVATRGYLLDSQERLNSMQADLDTLIEQKNTLEAELVSVYSSRTYRAARKIADTKHSVSKKIKRRG